jgi:hypothetical protein
MDGPSFEEVEYFFSKTADYFQKVYGTGEHLFSSLSSLISLF